jgi:lysozyme family protein
MSFDQAFNDLIGIEGKYSADEKDPGNWTSGKVEQGEMKGTMYGISAAAYPTLDIAGLTLQAAKAIYLRDFWNKLRCAQLPDSVATALFKEGVNLGVEGAARVFQKSLRVEVDGNIGNLTIGIATSQPPKDVLCGFLTEAAYEYTQMKDFPTYGKGWLSRVIKTAVEAQLSATEMAGSSFKADKP